jgi:hypothetical protein
VGGGERASLPAGTVSWLLDGGGDIEVAGADGEQVVVSGDAAGRWSDWGRTLVADRISLALMVSGVMAGPNFWTRRAAAPATMGVAMLVPLSSMKLPVRDPVLTVPSQRETLAGKLGAEGGAVRCRRRRFCCRARRGRV